MNSPFRFTSLFVVLCLMSACSETGTLADENNSSETPSDATSGTSSEYDKAKADFLKTGILTFENFSVLSKHGKKFTGLFSGKMTDMNGDGIPDMQLTTDDDGTMHMENFDADGNLRSYYIKYPDGSSHRLSDTNGDGNTDIQEDYTISPHRQIILTDRNYDGFPEERRTADFDYDNALMTVTEERDDEGKGNYVIIKKWSQKIITMRRAQEDKNGRLESNSDLKKTPTSRPMKSALLSSSTAMTLNMKNYLMPLTVPLDMEAIVFMR